jgi:hypothetical protein
MSASEWQKSSHCGEGDACLKVAAGPGTVKLMESGDPDAVILHTTPAAFASLTRALKDDTTSPWIKITHGPGDRVRLHAAGDGGRVVTTTRAKWDAFALGVRAGEFDHFGE